MDQTELFKNYLEGKLSPEDHRLVERLIQENPEYLTELEAFKKINPTPKSKGKQVKSWAISFAIALSIVAAGIFIFYRFGASPGEMLYQTHYEDFPKEYALKGPENPLFIQGIEAYHAKNYPQAVENFERLFIQTESDEIKFYLGISQLANGRPEKGIPVLSMIFPSSPLYPNASYYQGLGYLKLNKLAEAKKYLEISVAQKSIFADKAQEIVAKID